VEISVNTAQCLSDGVLHSLLVGMLTDDEVAACESHLAECPNCLVRTRNLKSSDTLNDLLSQAKGVEWSSEEEAEIQRLRSRLSDRERVAALSGVTVGMHSSSTPDRPSTSANTSDPSAQQPASTGLTASSLSPAEATAVTILPGGSSSSTGTSHTMVLQPTEGMQIGAYRLEKKLGEGGMGAVWKAFHTKLKKHVALKVLPTHLLRDAKLVGRFEREMEAVGRLDHPAIVRAMDADEVQGTHFLVMEYVEGQDLGELVKSRGARKVPEACEIIRQAAVGLAYAHKNGLVHRDIKPSNLFLTKDGKVKILDLGLARLQGDNLAAEPGAELTGSGQVLGTPDYMSPEQWENTHTVGPACDLYALGCTLFFLLTGRAPFGDDRHQTLPKKMMGHVHESPPELSAVRGQLLAGARKSAPLGEAASTPQHDIPPDLEGIYRRLMAKEPKDRFATAEELAAALLPIIKGKKPAAASDGSIELATGPAAADAAPQAPTVRAEKSQPVTPAVSLPVGPPTPPARKKVLAWGSLGAVLLLGVIVITIRYKDGSSGKVVLPKGADYSIGEEDDPADQKPSTSVPAATITGWHGWPADAPKPAIAPFDAAQAKRHQEEWAKYLDVPVEYTNSIGMKFHLIPPGEFLMGNTAEEIETFLKDVDPNDNRVIDCIRGEGPQHKVVLTQPIYFGTTEVTQAEYEKVTGKNPSSFAKTGSSRQLVDGLNTSRHPVEQVTWSDAAEFCAKLCQQEKLKPFYFRAGDTITPLKGTGYRLPTEAEWEYACRAGTTTRFWSGDAGESLVPVAWSGKNSRGRTHAAGELRPNPFGLHDIHGNVWELVQDAWDPDFYAQFRQQPAVDPSNPFTSRRALCRGGDAVVNGHDQQCRASYRNGSAAFDGFWYGIGFRVSLPVDAVRLTMKSTGRATPKNVAGWHGWPADAPKPAIAPFDAAQANQHQEEWAKYLNLPVEYTNSIGMKFRLIPPGEFLMGSTPEEIEESLKSVGEDKHWQECLKSEAPRHKVILTQPVYLGVNEVTQAEYQKVMGKNPSLFAKTGPDQEFVKTVENLDTTGHPVESVSWNDAAEFCAQLSQQEKLKPFYFRAGDTVTPLEGTGYRLPTEAEWEFSCRAGTTTKYWIGDTDEDLRTAGWFGTNSGRRTHAAGELKANPFGVFDIHGNVFEWVQDGWEPTYYGQFQERSARDPNGPSSAGSPRVIRSGDWGYAGLPCRSSLRGALDPKARFVNLGFRVSLPVDVAKVAIVDQHTKPANGTTGWHGWPADAPKPAIAPFDAVQAKKHQEEWAKYLKVPVEYTNSIGMKFRLIPPGEFRKGSTPQEIGETLLLADKPEWRDAIPWEGPQHKVILSQPIYSGVHEVTQSAFERVIGTNPSAFAAGGAREDKVQGVETKNHPVDMVSWDDAAEFCQKLSELERFSPVYARVAEEIILRNGNGYRLPTESEWESACRAGTTTRYWIGDSDEDGRKAAWCSENSDFHTHPVGEKQANPFGLHDVHGNVFEWIHDVWDAAKYRQFTNQSDENPLSALTPDTHRCDRGGAWNFPFLAARSAQRGHAPSSLRIDTLGFRVSLTVDAVRQALKVEGPAIPKSAPATEAKPGEVSTDDVAERKAAEALIALREARSIPLDVWVRSARTGLLYRLENDRNSFPAEPFSVHTLHDSSGKLTNDDLGLVAACPNLEVLSLDQNSPVTDDGLRRLKPLHRLTSLQLGLTGGLGEEVASLVESNPDLAVVTLDGTAASPKLLAAALGRCPRLRKLAIAATAVSPELYPILGKHCRDLRLLHVGEPHGVDLPALASLPRLRELSITGEHLKPGRGEANIKALASMPSLETLRFEPPSSNEGLQQLVPLAKKLRSLTVMGWYEWNPGATSEGWKTLEEFTSLESLYIGGYKSSLDGPTLLRLTGLPALKVLTLSFHEWQKGQFYTAADITEFRRLRPDVMLTAAVGKEWKTFPALEHYPKGPDGRSMAEWSLPKDAPAPAIVPFTPDEAKAHQEAWAKFVKQPVEIENSLGMKFRLVPPGERSTPMQERGPEVLYRLTQPYHLGTTEVTVSQFRKFLEETGHKPTGTLPGGRCYLIAGNGSFAESQKFWVDLPYELRDDDPATLVSHTDARAFCEWLSKKEGAVYRLPTESEWSFACAAGGEKEFGFAGTVEELREYAWDRSSLTFPLKKTDSALHRVATLKPNPFGLFDVLGNVHEMSLDRLPEDRLADVSMIDPVGETGIVTSYCGGAWRWDAAVQPTTFSPQARGATDVSVSVGHSHIGFRVLKQLPGAEPLPKPFEGPVTVNPGRPLSSQATVSRPAPIPGLRSWSIEPASHNGGMLFALAWSPRGDVLATAYGSDNAIRLWDREGKLKRVLFGHDEQVTSLSFSHDGMLLASGERRMGSGHGAVRLWDVATGTTRAVLTTTHWIHCVAFSPVDRELAFSGEGPVTLINLDTGRTRRYGDPGGKCIAWSPDGQSLVTGRDSGDMVVWRPSESSAATTLDAPDFKDGWKGYSSVAWSPDGKWIAGGNGQNVRIWNAETKSLERTIATDQNRVSTTAWGRDNRRLLVSGDGGAAWAVFDAREGTRLVDCKEVNSYAAAWNPDESEVAVWHQDRSGPLVFCDAATGKVLRRGLSRGSVTASTAHLSHDGRTIFAPFRPTRTLVFDAATGDLSREMATSLDGYLPFDPPLINVSPTGRNLLLWQASPWKATVVDAQNGRTLRRLEDEGVEPARAQLDDVAWSPDDRFVAIATGDGKIRIRDVATGELIRELAGHEGAIFNVVWSPDGARLASLGKDKTVRLWNPASGELVATYRDFPEEPYVDWGRRLCWTPDSRELWIALRNHAARLDIATGRFSVFVNLSQGNVVSTLTLSPDGDFLIGREDYGWTVLFDLPKHRGQVLGHLLGNGSQWLPDGRRIFGFEERTRRGIAYDTRTSRRLGTLFPALGGDDGFNEWLCVGPTGHYRGSAKIDVHVVYVAMHDDGSQVTYTPAEFREKFGWKNDPEKATLLNLLE
jgi:formylglycine-generating enzyme required for sulfatase activity/serine/threonine protein kinase/WD40 repeat protein